MWGQNERGDVSASNDWYGDICSCCPLEKIELKVGGFCIIFSNLLLTTGCFTPSRPHDCGLPSSSVCWCECGWPVFTFVFVPQICRPEYEN